MKRLVLFGAISLIVFSVAITGAIGSQTSIQVNKPCKTLPGLTMTQVTITEDKTLVDFEYVNPKGDWNISIYSPDSASTFVIRDKRSARTYKLQDAIGIAYYPNKVTIKEGEIKRFTLVFDKMPHQYLSAIEDVATMMITADYQ